MKLHDAFFAKADGVAQLDASLYVSELGDNPKKLETCTAASKSRLARDMTIAERFRIPGTPTFLVGIIKADGGVSVRRKLLGSQTIEQIQEVVEEVRKEG